MPVTLRLRALNVVCARKLQATLSPVSTRRRFAFFTLAALGTVLTAALSFGKPAPRGPLAPQSSASAAASASGSAAGSAVPAQPPAIAAALHKAQRGVVLIERAGRPLGMGFVLSGDGRVLTALSVVGDGNGLDARYADGSVVHLRVGHSDRVWDLALLVPQVGRWEEGLIAATADPLQAGSQIRTFTQRQRQVRLASVVLKRRGELVGGDAEVLRDALQMTTQVPPLDFGAPLVDQTGSVMALVARACEQSEAAPGKPCKSVAYGAPIDVLRQFLRSAPANAIPPTPWLGIQGLAAETAIARGVRVVEVHPDSPASRGGLHASEDPASADIIVAVDGTPVQSPENLASIVRERAVGDTVDLIVVRQGKYQVLKIQLKEAPGARTRSQGTPR